ncbi:MAG TPA: hypothetical protein DHV67_03150 [Gallionella sp.]|nr:hypothetical protein [Gallionella sp.]
MNTFNIIILGCLVLLIDVVACVLLSRINNLEAAVIISIGVTMIDLISVLVGLSQAILFALLALYINSGTLPGARLYHTYRLHRDTYGCGRLTALRKAWFICRH